ncbi:MAG: hexameric tyrosine-coordinated heme protein [Pseudomonadales bacterium]|jgi:hypothetical protein|nr:hexameric tyrosine-coordinated heme protein [Pseudomonadales bacterium]
MARFPRASIVAACLVLASTATSFAAAEDRERSGTLSAIPDTLRCETPADGYALAIRLSRLAVKATQPDVEVLKDQRDDYAETADGLIAAAEVVALNFRTIAEANDYWR